MKKHILPLMAMALMSDSIGGGFQPFKGEEPLRNRKWPSDPDQKQTLKPFSFTVNGKRFECEAYTRKDAIAKLNVWKRKNKIK